MDWLQIHKELEALVVLGKHQQCRSRLDQISPKHIPRVWATRFAELAARVHHSIFALKTLHCYVFPENRFDPIANDKERTVYAYALLNLGAVDEALEILDSIDTAKEPEALFIKALALVRNWNYKASVSVLADYVASPGLSPYRALVGEVNRAAAYIFLQDWDAATPLLDRIQHHCESQSYKLLLGNCLELKAQVHFFKKEYDAALICLESARRHLENQSGLYLLFVEKWEQLCLSFQSPLSPEVEKIRQVRAKALELSDWETMRDCDLFEAILTNNENLIRKTVFGTPSEYYRRRVRLLYTKPIKAIGSYEYLMGPPVSGPVPLFDPLSNKGRVGSLFDKPLLLALFEALTMDLYKPYYIGALFKQLYPLEKFNPFSSPPRVIQLLKRLDQWFVDSGLPLRVRFKKSEFSLTSSSPIKILIRRGQKLSHVEGQWLELKTQLSGRTFSSAKVAEILGISKTSAKQLVSWALNDGRLISLGRGRNTCYRLSNRRRSKAA